jgi:protein involved in polysaccharide export with SLBB domain
MMVKVRSFSIRLTALLGITFALSAQLALAADVSRNAVTPAGETTLLSVGAPSSETLNPMDSPELKAGVYANYTGRKYRLGPNDVISVSVFDSPEFNYEKILVQPDGNVVMAPFGTMQVAGMTIDEFKGDLEDRLKTYLNDPQVSVRLDTTKPFTVYVSGAVQKPGGYEMVTDVFRNQNFQNSTPEIQLERKSPLLSNILVAAGGLDYDADLEHVQITNKFDHSTFDVNLLDLIQTGNSDNDLFLVAGDSINVPRLATPYAVDDAKYKTLLGSTVFQKTIPVKVYGYVNQPGLVHLDSSQSANLLSAITSAGGYLREREGSSSYAPSEVFVSRTDAEGHLVTRKVDPRHEDMVLYPNDIVYVPEKLIPKIGKGFDYAARIVAPFANMASGFTNWALLFNPSRFVR